MSEVWRADNEGIIEGTGTSPQGGACEFTWIDRAAVSVCWAGFSRAVTASLSYLDLTSPSVCHQHLRTSGLSICYWIQLYINCLVYLNHLHMYSVGDSLYSIGCGIPNGCGSKVIDRWLRRLFVWLGAAAFCRNISGRIQRSFVYNLNNMTDSLGRIIRRKRNPLKQWKALQRISKRSLASSTGSFQTKY